jgi:phosphatidylglycerol---prolipoprotein diacylglyceryl transferase
MSHALIFPDFDPVLLRLGPFAIHWYAIAYIAALVIGWRLVRRMALWPPAVATPVLVDDFLSWATLGVVLGGRIGYVLFYQPGNFLHHPLSIIAVWQGGMSFHGGMLGVTIAIIVFCLRHRIPILGFADRIAIVAPIGLGFGRIANFINGELWGKTTDVPWAMVFCNDTIRRLHGSCPAGMEPRHPSQLYEAALEGLVLFALLQLGLRYFKLHERPGLLTGLFFTGYGVFRFFVEFFREPDGPFLGWFSMGMALSIPLWVAAGAFLWTALRPHVNGRA